MHDTPDEVLAIQRQIMHKMSAKERVALGMRQIDDIRQLAENSLKLAHPEATLAELKVLLFRRYYAHDLGPEDLQKCAEQLLQYWQSQTG